MLSTRIRLHSECFCSGLLTINFYHLGKCAFVIASAVLRHAQNCHSIKLLTTLSITFSTLTTYWSVYYKSCTWREFESIFYEHYTYTAVVRPFVSDNPGGPVLEETFTHSHLKRVVDFMRDGEDNRGKCADNPAGRHPIRTIDAPTSIISPFFTNTNKGIINSLSLLVKAMYDLCQFTSLICCISQTTNPARALARDRFKN